MMTADEIARFQGMARLGAHELNDKEKFAVEAMDAIKFEDHWLCELCSRSLLNVCDLLDEAEKEMRRSHRTPPEEFYDSCAAVLKLVNTAFLVVVPAAYAYDGNTHQGLPDVIDRYIVHCLKNPLTREIDSHIKYANEVWRMSGFVWEALDQKRWIGADNPEAYISATARSLFLQAEMQADREHIRAAKAGKYLVNASGESRVTDDGIIEYAEAMESVSDCDNLSTKPDTSARAMNILTEQLAHCGEILENGGSVADVAEYLGVSSKHAKQEVGRMRERACLVDESEPISFHADLRHLLPKLRAHPLNHKVEQAEPMKELDNSQYRMLHFAEKNEHGVREIEF